MDDPKEADASLQAPFLTSVCVILGLSAVGWAVLWFALGWLAGK